MIEIKKVREHYEIYVNGEFKCSCDINELSETISDLENK